MVERSSGSGTGRVVLLVDDSGGDARLTLEALRHVDKTIQLHVAADGVEAMAFLNREVAHALAPRPDLVLLDLNLPRMTGFEVLAQMREDESLRTIPTVVLTTSQSPVDVAKSYWLGANAYVSKPMDFDAFLGAVESIIDFWLVRAHLPASTSS